mgnify:CR=1 FL=1
MGQRVFARCPLWLRAKRSVLSLYRWPCYLLFPPPLPLTCHCSTAVSSAYDERHTTRSAAVNNAADGRRTTTFSGLCTRQQPTRNVRNNRKLLIIQMLYGQTNLPSHLPYSHITPPLPLPHISHSHLPTIRNKRTCPAISAQDAEITSCILRTICGG